MAVSAKMMKPRYPTTEKKQKSVSSGVSKWKPKSHQSFYLWIA